ncbi:MAG: cysteine desulfurase [Lachnospiraceae bacterium]|nr:cysteine desulfurase [Lachnospiraceae bacterium]
MEIYFDNAATTRIDAEVEKKIEEINRLVYANPSAMHRLGYFAEEQVKKSSETIANILHCDSSEIIWTSGGSESNNMAIRGYTSLYKKSGNKIVTTKMEHASVYKVFESLKEDGFEVIYIDVDSEGHINIDELKQIVDSNTILVSIMYVNNEIGSVQKIEEIGKLIKENNMNCAFHVDFVQGFAKYRINVKKSCIDFLSISSHKFNGPKGVGILYKNKDVRVKPLILGGSQQNDLRAGTLNVPGIVGTATAAKIAYEIIDEEYNKLKNLKEYLIDKLEQLNDIYGIISINSKKDESFAPHIVSVTFKNIRAEVMLHALEDKGVYVSAGSACSSHQKKLSRTLTSIGLKSELVESTIRISFGKYNKKEEIDNFIEILNELIPKLNIRK